MSKSNETFLLGFLDLLFTFFNLLFMLSLHFLGLMPTGQFHLRRITFHCKTLAAVEYYGLLEPPSIGRETPGWVKKSSALLASPGAHSDFREKEHALKIREVTMTAAPCP